MQKDAGVLKFLPAGRQGYTDMYYVYVLKSLVDGSFYKGRTGDLDRRFKEHNGGKTVSNRTKRPFILYM